MNELLDAEKKLFPQVEAFDKEKWTAWQTLKAFVLAQLSHNTGRQCALQMPPSCPECVVYRGCDGHRGNDYCSARLWRHFCHA
jgi:hypothetical protein